MSEIVSNSLQKIAKGSTFVFIGTILSLLFGFLARIIMVRFSTQNEYGVYSLVLTIVSICTTISTLGLEEGATRYIAYLRGKKEEKDIHDTIISSIIVALMASILIVGAIFTSSNYLAIKVFNEPTISFILRIMSISVPFTVLTSIIVSIFRGFDKTYVKVYLNNILRPSIYLLLLGAVILLKRSFIDMVLVYVISLMITFLIVFIYFVKNSPIKLVWKQVCINHNTKKLIRFSLPLLTVSLLLTVMSWTDTLMLGYFKTAETVAAYNAAYPLANLLSPGINSIGFLYMPIISNLYSENRIKELGLINESSTKWSFVITLPIFFILFIFPEFILSSFYGSQYVEASSVLQILSVGFVVNSFFGLNYYTLMATGNSLLLMNCSLISTIINVILNLILIPPFGMLGAAIASAVSFTLIEIYMTLRLYRLLKIHPFTKIYIKITILTILLVGIGYTLRNIFVQTFWTITVFNIVFWITYLILIFCTKSVDEEDTKILFQIEKRVISSLPAIKKVLLIFK